MHRPDGSPFHVGEKQNVESSGLVQPQLATNHVITSYIGASPCRLNGNVTRDRGVTRGRTDIDGIVDQTGIQPANPRTDPFGSVAILVISFRRSAGPDHFAHHRETTLRWAGPLQRPTPSYDGLALFG